MKILLFIFTIALLFMGCGEYSRKIYFQLDNPTENVVHVTIDSTAYQLQPDRSERVALTVGMHTIALPDGQSVKFNVYDKSKGGIINPTKSTYVLFTQVYATNEKTARHFITQKNKIYIDGVYYEGPLSTITDLFIDKNYVNYTYGLREALPKRISGSSDRNGDFRSKIFTKKEFITFYEEDAGTQGFHEQHKVAGAVDVSSQTYHRKQIPTPHFQNAEIQAAAESVTEILKKYLASTHAKEQKELLLEYQVKSDELYEKSKVMDKMDLFDKQRSIELKAYNDFTWICGVIINIGIAEVKQ